MKKIISLIMAIALTLSLTTAVFAEDCVKILVDGRTITFREDTKPVIINDRTYVPVRRVLESMGARVKWDGEKRTVTVDSSDNIYEVILTIDNPELTVYHFTSVIKAEESKVMSDVAPIILNDRTMLPIRVIAESIGAKVEYNEADKFVTITTSYAQKLAEVKFNADPTEENFSVADAVSEDLPKLSLECDAKDIKEGDEVVVKVKALDIDKKYEGATVAGIVACIFYSKENFSFEDFKLVSNEGDVQGELSANNPNFYENGVKIATVMTGAGFEPQEDGTVMELTFTALNSNGGAFTLSNGLSEIGYDSELILKVGNDTMDLYKYTELYVDTNAVFVK